jgi:signal transduction histidine kinase
MSSTKTVPNDKSVVPAQLSDVIDNLAQSESEKACSNVKHLLEHKQLSTSSTFTEEEERKRLSRELHDGLGQILTTIGLQVKQCLNGYEHDQGNRPSPNEHRASLEQLSSMVQEAIGEVRSLCSAIRPAILDDLGVLAAISWQCRQISKASPGLSVVTDYRLEEGQIPVGYRTTIYRIVQESMNNALKYANASRIGVSISLKDESIHLSITDNGCGFDQSTIQQRLGVGLMSMRDRAESIHGKLEIDAAIQRGVEIRVLFPLKETALCNV